MSATTTERTLNMGPDTLAIPVSMFRENRERVCEALLRQPTDVVRPHALVLLQGGDSINLYNTDVEYVFRQEPFFMYHFGVLEPGFFGIVDVSSRHSTLFVPRLPQEYATWMGRLKSNDEVCARYGVDEVHFVDELAKVIAEKNPPQILTLHGQNSDSKLFIEPATFESIEKYNVDKDILFKVASECRVIKSPQEIEVLRYVARVSADAHRAVMRAVRPGLLEYQAEAEFLKHAYYVGGCRHASYTCICAAGDNSSVLHYGHAAAPNDRTIAAGDMCLFDMGANYFGYAADITCSFPASGRFTERQRGIYEAVLAANEAVQRAARPGVRWPDMHRLANRVVLEHLRRLNIVRGDIDAMMAAGLNGVFQPHGLGHLIGLDVHDVGAYPDDAPPRPTEPGLQSLRFARVLQPGMYVTVEPGCYFIDHLLDKALADPVQSAFLVPEVLQQYRGFGGVRIEDDVLVTADGVENFSIVPRTVEEIESFMAKV